MSDIVIATFAGALSGTAWWFVHCARTRRCPFCAGGCHARTSPPSECPETAERPTAARKDNA